MRQRKTAWVAGMLILAMFNLVSCQTDTGKGADGPGQPGVPAETAVAPIETPDGAEERTLWVGPVMVDCTGVGPQRCLLVKDSPAGDWLMFYDPIAGFNFAPGYEYELRVLVEPVPNPPADGSSLRYTLIEVVNRTPADGIYTR